MAFTRSVSQINKTCKARCKNFVFNVIFFIVTICSESANYTDVNKTVAFTEFLNLFFKPANYNQKIQYNTKYNRRCFKCELENK